MKVLVFTSLYPNHMSQNHGVFVKERMVNVANLNGCSLRVVAPVPYYPRFGSGWRRSFSMIKPYEVIEGIEVNHPRYFMTPKVGMTFYGMKMFLSVLPTVIRLQKEFDFDLIDAHYIYPDGFAAVLLGSLFRKPVVVSARGSDINLYKEFPLIRRLLQYTLGKADRVIAVCQALKNEMIRLGVPPEKVAVIPNGVAPGKFYPIPKNKARNRLRLPVDRKLILSVGELIPRKGFDLLIQAVKLLSNECRRETPHLVIIGEGRMRQKLKRLISSLHLEESVYLVGAIPHEELHLWYSAADLFCLASSREGWPNVVMESLACGTPVVATSVWGTPEIIQSDRVGILTKRSPREIAANISLALSKSWQADELVEYTSEHTWERVARSVFHEFKLVLDGKTPA